MPTLGDAHLLDLVREIRTNANEPILLSMFADLPRMFARSSPCKLGYNDWIAQDFGADDVAQFKYSRGSLLGLVLNC